MAKRNHPLVGDGYSRMVRYVPFRVDYRTGEIFESRKRKRKVLRRVKQFRNTSGYLLVNDGTALAPVISAIISNHLRNSDFFASAPDHHPRRVGSLYDDFHRTDSSIFEKLSDPDIDHLARDFWRSHGVGNPLRPVASGADTDAAIFDGHDPDPNDELFLW